MRTRVQIIKRNFYVNKEKGVVTCVITTWNSPNTSLGDYIDGYGYATKDRRVLCRHTFIATAKCSPLDIFDENKGKRIAESRAKVKAFKYYMNVYTKISQVLNDVSTEISNIALACKYASETELKHIKELDNDSKCG